MKRLKKIGIAIVLLIMLTVFMNASFAQVDVNSLTNNIDVNTLTKEDILNLYDEIVKEYSPETIANMIEENTKEIEEQGVSKEVIQAGANFIRETDTESIREIIENDIDIEEVKEKIQKGYTADQIVSSIVEEAPTQKKVEIASKLLLSNQIIKNILTVIVVLFLYGTILRWILYIKAGEQGWAAIVPVYRQIVMYKICGLSPWLMLLWFVPIFGWLAMFVVAIMKRFCLAKEFGRGALFGFGLLFFGLIFQSILAFNPRIQKSEKEA